MGKGRTQIYQPIQRLGRTGVTKRLGAPYNQDRPKTPPENSPISIIGTKNYSGVYIGRYIDQLSLDSAFVPNGIQKGDSGGAVICNGELIGITTSFSFISNESMYFVRREGIRDFVELYGRKK